MTFSCSPGHDTSPDTLDTLRSPLWTVLAGDSQLRSVNCDQTATPADTATPGSASFDLNQPHGDHGVLFSGSDGFLQQPELSKLDGLENLNSELHSVPVGPRYSRTSFKTAQTRRVFLSVPSISDFGLDTALVPVRNTMDGWLQETTLARPLSEGESAFIYADVGI